MIHEIVQLVEVWDADGDPVESLSAKFYLTERNLFMADKFTALITGGNKTARVRREITETIGGPHYSSIKVSTAIEVTCDQSESVIREAAQACLAEASILNEEGVMQAYKGLLDHRKNLGLKEE